MLLKREKNMHVSLCASSKDTETVRGADTLRLESQSCSRCYFPSTASRSEFRAPTPTAAATAGVSRRRLRPAAPRPRYSTTEAATLPGIYFCH